jgi:hypothetical protein
VGLICSMYFISVGNLLFFIICEFSLHHLPFACCIFVGYKMNG